MIDIFLLAKQQRECQEDPLNPMIVAWMDDTYLDIVEKRYEQNAGMANHDAEKLLKSALQTSRFCPPICRKFGCPL